MQQQKSYDETCVNIDVGFQERVISGFYGGDIGGDMGVTQQKSYDETCVGCWFVF